MYWDRIAQYETHDRSDKYWIRRFLFAPDKMEFHCFGESVWGLPETFTMTRVAKDLVPEKIELPPIKLPEYYYLYEKYKDVFDGDLKSFSDFESKYGKCALVRRSESIHDTYYYIAEVDSENCPTYYISIYQTNGNILSAELIRADRLPEGAIRNEW
jgi:hypothetical protein